MWQKFKLWLFGPPIPAPPPPSYSQDSEILSAKVDDQGRLVVTLADGKTWTISGPRISMIAEGLGISFTFTSDGPYR